MSSAGLQTTVQPAASAGAILRAIIAAGKFHGVIAATTPTGSFSANMRLPRSGCGNDVAVGARRFLGEPLDVARAHTHLAAAFGERLALLARDQAAEVVLVRHDQVVPALEDLRRAAWPARRARRGRRRARRRRRRARRRRRCRARWRRRRRSPDRHVEAAAVRGSRQSPPMQLRPGSRSSADGQWHVSVPWTVGRLTQRRPGRDRLADLRGRGVAAQVAACAGLRYQHRLDRRHDRVVRRAAGALASGRGSRASSRPTRSSRSGWRCSCRRCRAPSRAPARTATGTCAPGSGCADGARPIVPVHAGPRSDRMSPNRLRRHHHVEARPAAARSARTGCRCAACRPSPPDSRAAIASARPSHHGMLIAMPLLLVATVTCLRGRAAASSKAYLQHAVGAVAREHRLLDHDLALGALRTSRRRGWCTRPRCSRARRRSRCRRACGRPAGSGTPSNRRTGRRLMYWSNSRRNLSSEPHSEMWSGTMAGQPTAPK